MIAGYEMTLKSIQYLSNIRQGITNGEVLRLALLTYQNRVSRLPPWLPLHILLPSYRVKEAAEERKAEEAAPTQNQFPSID